MASLQLLDEASLLSSTLSYPSVLLLEEESREPSLAWRANAIAPSYVLPEDTSKPREQLLMEWIHGFRHVLLLCAMVSCDPAH